MAIEFDCPHCTTSIRVPDSANGKKGKCPRCGQVVRVPKIKIPTAAAASPEDSAEPKTEAASNGPSEESPARPAWMKGTRANEEVERGAESSVERPPVETGGFVEAAPVGPPDFSALAAEEPDEEPLIRTEAPQRPEPPPPPAAEPADFGEIPAFDEEGPAAEPTPTGPGTSTSPPAGRRVRRRRKKKPPRSGPPPWAIPVACVVVIAGLYLWWTWGSAPKLEGTLKAEAFGFLRPPSKTLDASTAGMDAVEFGVLVAALEQENLHIQSPFLRVDVRGRNNGIEVRVVETRDTRFVKVLKNDKELQRFMKESAEELQDAKLVEMRAAIKRFAAYVAENGPDISGDAEMQRLVLDEIALAVLTGSLGCHVEAKYDRRSHRCCYEDGEGVYFLLPKAAETFRLEGREVGGTKSFTGDYTVLDVKVFEGEMPADYVDPWSDSADEPRRGERGNEAPPLSGEMESPE